MQKIILVFLFTTTLSFAQNHNTGGGNIVSPGCMDHINFTNRLLELINKSPYKPLKNNQSRFGDGQDGLEKFYKHIQNLIIKTGFKELDNLTINKQKVSCGDPILKQQIIKENPWITNPKVVKLLLLINTSGHRNKIKCSHFDYKVVNGYIEFLQLWLPEEAQGKIKAERKRQDMIMNEINILNRNEGYGG